MENILSCNILGVKLIILLLFLLFSCVTEDLPPRPEPSLDNGPAVPKPEFPASVDHIVPDVFIEPLLSSHAPFIAEPKFEASKELFDQTFAEIRNLVSRLNVLIREKDYQSWLSFLSPEYIRMAGSKEILTSQSESAILKSRGIVLRDLQDFFIHVVVPSRANVRIDDIVFLGEAEVEAIMLYPGSRRISVYRLIKKSDAWLIGP